MLIFVANLYSWMLINACNILVAYSCADHILGFEALFLLIPAMFVITSEPEIVR